MTHIKDVSETYALPTARLKERGVETVAELWASIGKEVDSGVKQVVERTRDPAVPQPNLDAADRQTHAALLAFLIADAISESTGRDPVWIVPKKLWRRIQTGWRKRDELWPDWVLLALLLLIIGWGLRAQFLQRSVVQRVAVRPGVALPALAPIDTQQLMLVSTFDQPGTFATIEELKARYPATGLNAGTVVKDEQLLPAGLSVALAGRQLLTLPIKNDTGKLPKPMERVQLMLASRDKDKPGLLIPDAILLSTTKTGDSTSAVVAVTGPAAASMAPLLGLSDVFVLQTLP